MGSGPPCRPWGSQPGTWRGRVGTSGWGAPPKGSEALAASSPTTTVKMAVPSALYSLQNAAPRRSLRGLPAAPDTPWEAHHTGKGLGLGSAHRPSQGCAQQLCQPRGHFACGARSALSPASPCPAFSRVAPGVRPLACLPLPSSFCRGLCGRFPLPGPGSAGP